MKMIVGSSQIDITPQVGVNLSGFAARVQPSIGVLDPLFVRGLYLASGQAKLLWLHADLVGFDRATVVDFRRWAKETYGLDAHEVMLSATHTHAGPQTVDLGEVGGADTRYIQFLLSRLQESASKAIAKAEEVDCVSVEGRLELAVDRRKRASAHSDSRVAALGFRRADGTFAAAVVNYPIHPVALGATNRCISADISGQAALSLSNTLSGHPIVLVTNGACGNLNPPGENVPMAKVREWGVQIADSVAALLANSKEICEPQLQTVSRVIQLPVDTLGVKEIHETAERALQNPGPVAEWGDIYRNAVLRWKADLLEGGNKGRHGGCKEVELFAIHIGEVSLVGVNAEVFSEFTDWLRNSTGKRVYLIGYANGDVGYLPTKAAYAEGGYEVDVAYFFYGGFRPQSGSLELLAAEASKLLVHADPAPALS
jgi:hypothetical protein